MKDIVQFILAIGVPVWGVLASIFLIVSISAPLVNLLGSVFVRALIVMALPFVLLVGIWLLARWFTLLEKIFEN